MKGNSGKVSDYTYALLIANRPHGATHYEFSSNKRSGGYMRLNQEGCWDYLPYDAIWDEQFCEWVEDVRCNTGEVDTSEFIKLE